MKKIIGLLLIAIVCAFLVMSKHVETPDALAGLILTPATTGGAADPCSCPTASYLSCYTGDHASGVNYICYDSGNSNKNGTENGTITVTSSYVEITGTAEGLEWAVSTDDLAAGDVGTFWLTVYVDVATITGVTAIFEITSANNNDMMSIRVNNDGTVRGIYRQNDVPVNLDSVATLSGQTATRIGYTWDQPNDKHKVYITTTGLEATTAGLNGLAVVTQMQIGEEFGGPVNHTYRGYDLTIFSTYDVADPAPL